MPAVLAHWVVANDVAWRFITNTKEGYSFFQGSPDDQYGMVSKYLYLGASGPDIPYFYDADIVGKYIKKTVGKSEYADLFHYNKQAEFILQLVKVAEKYKENDRARYQRTMSYALGHTTHLAADSVVHPYVNCYAGAYHKQSIDDIHKISECHQDSWLAHKYFGRDYIDEGASWTEYLPECIQIQHIPAPIPAIDAITTILLNTITHITMVKKETQQVFSDIVTAFNITHKRKLDLKYMTESYGNMYSTVIDRGYDWAVAGIPKKPHMHLVQHKELGVKYYNLLRKDAVEEAEKACQAVIALCDSEISEDDENKFRSEVKNWNMDTGYWIDVTLEDNKLKIIWRHRWCKQESIFNEAFETKFYNEFLAEDAVTPLFDTNKLSGSHWKKIADENGWRNSTSVDDLSDEFRLKVMKFKQALDDAGADYQISSTYRHPIRAWIMHHAWRIWKSHSPPTDDPYNTEIIWDHGDSRKTRKAAEEMKNAFNMAYPASLTSRHISGNAIDWTIKWSDDLDIKDESGNEVKIDTLPRQGGMKNAHTPAGNRKLHEVGATYGVIKLVRDPPHWSDTGT